MTWLYLKIGTTVKGPDPDTGWTREYVVYSYSGPDLWLQPKEGGALVKVHRDALGMTYTAK